VDRAMDALSSSDEMPADVFCNQRRWVSYQCSKFWYGQKIQSDLKIRIQQILRLRSKE
jgi:hypothetical protein